MTDAENSMKREYNQRDNVSGGIFAIGSSLLRARRRIIADILDVASEQLQRSSDTVYGAAGREDDPTRRSRAEPFQRDMDIVNDGLHDVADTIDRAADRVGKRSSRAAATGTP